MDELLAIIQPYLGVLDNLIDVAQCAPAHLPPEPRSSPVSSADRPDVPVPLLVACQLQSRSLNLPGLLVPEFLALLFVHGDAFDAGSKL